VSEIVLSKGALGAPVGLEDRGVRETIAVGGLTVLARARGQEARWTGATNGDGVAEVSLEIEGIAAGDPVDLEVRAEGDPAPLAAGRAAWRDVNWATPEAGADRDALAAVRPTSQRGPIMLDVVIEGGRLVPGFTTPVFVRATPPPGISPGGLTIAVTPEPGLRPEKETVTTCDNGWAEIPVVAEAHVTGAGFRASAREGQTGEWFGGLPVAPGAFFVSAPRLVEENRAVPVVLVAPNPRTVVYAELDDDTGRILAVALPVERQLDAGDAVPRARFTLPPLAAGAYWLVVSGEPRGAEHLGGAAIARPVLVGNAPGMNVQDACSAGPWLAKRRVAGFPRWLALDGMHERSAKNRTKHRLGLIIGLVALIAAGILEVLLLVAASREARIAFQLAELDEDANAAKPPGGGLAIALCLAILGFALLSVLMVMKG
jgi:hypothetical protein